MLYRRAAPVDRDAVYNLAMVLILHRNRVAAGVKLLQVAADLGSADAAHNLAVSYARTGA